jgi:hypothetical protein
LRSWQAGAQLAVLLGVCWTFLEIFLRQFDCCWDWLGI